MKTRKSSSNNFVRRRIILVGALLFSAISTRADTTEIVASDNAFVLRSKSGNDQVETETLSAKKLNDSNTRIVYLRFNLTSFLTTHSISGITTANLRLYQKTSIADTIRIYGLNSSIGGTNEFDNVWTGIMTWDNQPAKTASPNDISSSSTALPNGNTTIALASLAHDATSGEKSFTLNLANFQSFLTTNGDANITLLFTENSSGNQSDYASKDNTGGFLQPTLELVAPVLVSATVTWNGATSSDWDTNTMNWTAENSSPTNFLQGNSTRFDDGLVAHNAINLTMPLLPASTTVSNFNTDFTFSGPGSLTGKLLKQGTGRLTIDNSSANGFSSVTISNGTLQVGNNDANGSLGSLTVTNYGSLVYNRTTNITANYVISGTGSVTKNGPGTLTFAATHTYTGNTIINNGTLVANGLPGGGILTNAAGSTLAMSGSNAGPVNVNGTLAPGGASAAATFTAGGGVTLGSAAVLSFDVGPTNAEGGGVNDLLLVNGNLAENGTIKAVPTLGAPLLGVPYILAEFSSASGSFTTTSGGHYTAVFNQTPTNLTVTFSGSGANLKWDSASSSAWDAGVTTNWLNGASLDYFYQGDTVTFDDTAAQTTVALSGTMLPAAITNNSSANNYTIGGGKISGAANIVKSGSSTLTLNNANDFTGTVTVNAGKLVTGNNAALGATNGGTTIASGATLDVNSRNLGQEPVTVSGIGTDGSGAIINNLGGATTFSNVNLSRITLAGDTTVGGSARLDLRSPATGDPSQGSLTMLGGGGFNLTKTGANQLAIVGMTVDPNLANVDVQSGILSIEAATTGMGNPAANLTVESGATLGFFNMTNQLNKNIILNGNGINGFFGTINNLSGDSTVIGPMTMNGDVQITFLNNIGGTTGGSLTLSNTISGTGSLTKNNTNTLTLAGMDNRNANTVINEGTFIFNGIHNVSNVLYTVDITTVLGGNGTNAGSVTTDGTLHPGAAGRPSTFGAGALQVGFINSPPTIFDLSSNTTVGNGVNDLLTVYGDVTANGNVIYIHPLGLLNTNAAYTLVKYGGNLDGFNSTPQIDPAYGASRYQFSLTQGSGLVQLTVSGGPAAIEWNNAGNNGLWDINSSQNWSNLVSAASPDKFYNQDTILLDDNITNSATPLTTLSIPGGTAVLPTLLSVNSTTNYIISGAGKISGTAGIVKTGGSSLTLLTTNDFTGNTFISGGSVVVGNNGALGATAATVIITNGGTLDLAASPVADALNFGAKQFVVSGWGVNSNGAIVNNNSANRQLNAFQNVTLAGDAALGGPQRWDIRWPASTNAGAVLSTGGKPFKLTKTGTNFIALSSVTVDPALADIDVQAGTLSIETQTTGLGNPANNVTVFSNATLELWNLTNVISKPIVLQAGSTLINGSGNNTYNGPIAVQGDATLNVGGLGLTLNTAMTGSGNLTRSGTAPLALTANNTISGGVLLTSGTTTLTGSGAFSASTNIFVASGATLDASGRGDFKITLNSGQTLSGSGQIVGLAQESPGAAISPGGKGVIGTLTVSSSATLQGNTYMEVTNNGALFDVLHAGTVIYGGTLTVSNLDATHPFTTNSTWQLFNAGTYTGVFTNIVPANPNGDSALAWDTNNLTLNGTLKVKAVVVGPPPIPHITAISLSGVTLTLAATNGSSGGQYMLLSSTNVSLPLSQWQTNVTGNFDGTGHLNLSTNIINPSEGQRFYLLKQ